MTEKEKQILQELYLKHSLVKLCKILNLTRVTIYSKLKQAGIPLKGRKGRSGAKPKKIIIK